MTSVPHSTVLSEAESQVLASLGVLAASSTPADRETLARRADSYWIYGEDWTQAFGQLQARKMIVLEGDVYHLTDIGRPLAERFRSERPDMYWYHYQKFYTAAASSAAHSALCKRVFGKDLCQDGQTDIAALSHLISELKAGPGDMLLDLGCGAGFIAEYVAHETGASVLGLDYSGSAIEAARERCRSRGDQLRFRTANFNAFDFGDAQFDAVFSLDTLYWAADLTGLMARLLRAVRPGGRFGAFMNHHIGADDGPDRLAVEHSALAVALRALEQPFQWHDYTQEIGAFWRRNCAAAEDLLAEYQAEGNGFIAEGLIRESRDEYLPDVEAGRIARYLFIIDKK